MITALLMTAVMLSQIADGYPFYSVEDQIRNRVHQNPDLAYTTIESLLQQGKAMGGTAATVADNFAKAFAVGMGVIAQEDDITTVQSYAEERRMVRDILEQISPPEEGGNADEIYQYILNNIVVIGGR